jgi:hypothetical protein
MLDVYKSTGRLALTVRRGDRSHADYLVLLIRQGMIQPDPELWEIYTRRKPVCAVKAFDAPLVAVYDMNETRESR